MQTTESSLALWRKGSLLHLSLVPLHPLAERERASKENYTLPGPVPGCRLSRITSTSSRKNAI